MTDGQVIFVVHIKILLSHEVSKSPMTHFPIVAYHSLHQPLSNNLPVANVITEQATQEHQTSKQFPVLLPHDVVSF